MPYRLLNIGQLLFLLPNPELKQKVRILEKLNKRFINAKIGTIFNRTYIYIYIYFFLSYSYEKNLGSLRMKVSVSFVIINK